MNNNIKLLQSYTNGNYNVKIYSDGTKIRMTKEDKFIPEFPESIDMKITDYCEVGCPMCHENSSIKGKHANFNYKFLDTLKEGTEIALGGGNALSHPNLKKILEKLNSKNIIYNMTIHNSIKEFDLLISLLYKKLIHGLGISANNPKEFRNVENILNILIKNGISTDNIVLHVIEGIVNYKDLIEFKDILPDKLLILGNKLFGRGIEYNHKNGLWLNEKRKMLVNNIDQIFRTFKVVATDNLAIETLELRKRLDEYTFNSYYMGDEGEFTMYIDLVEGKYAKNSTTRKYERKDIKNNIIDMFKDL
jgi:hypothetical protein|nr:MAG TPA: Radical SAM superfamily [Crassvirales sp.]